MEILNLFGVDWKLMIAQIINFAIVAAVLWFFAIKPLTKTMEARSKEISQGLDDAKKSSDRLDEVEKEVKDKLQATKLEAAKILEEAKGLSNEAKKASLENTKQEVEVLIAKAKEQINGEKTNMIEEVRSQVADMVVVALNKILSEGLSKDIDKKYIEKALKDFK